MEPISERNLRELDAFTTPWSSLTALGNGPLQFEFLLLHEWIQCEDRGTLPSQESVLHAALQTEIR